MVKSFQAMQFIEVFLSNLIVIICLKSSKWPNSFIWPIYETLICITNLDQNDPGSNDKEEVIHIHKVPEIEPHHQMV